jgi:dTDP-4-amino-4,6-dideoxy-D-galactose acyltransferase
MCNSKIEYMAWDSDFFNKKIGRIFVENSTDLGELLSCAQQQNYKLIYVFGASDYFPEEKNLEKFDGKLVDRKVLYEKHLIKVLPISNDIEKYEKSKLTLELETLAYLSGEFSRFRLDENFDDEDFYRMYKTWIEKSLTKQMADNVFVVLQNGIHKGLATLKINKETGYIGLIAVAPDMQGNGYGRKLLYACEKELFAQNIFLLEVSTQLNNIQACCFYEKCGFVIKSVTNIYHFKL